MKGLCRMLYLFGLIVWYCLYNTVIGLCFEMLVIMGRYFVMVCEDNIRILSRTIGSNQFIHKKIVSYVMTSKYGHHVILICLIDWFIVRANQSQRSETWRFRSHMIWILTVSLASNWSRWSVRCGRKYHWFMYNYMKFHQRDQNNNLQNQKWFDLCESLTSLFAWFSVMNICKTNHSDISYFTTGWVSKMIVMK